MLICSKTHLVKIKVAAVCSNPNNFTQNKSVSVEQVTLQKGYIWDYIHINWGDVKILNNKENVKSENISVPLIDRTRLRRLFSKSKDISTMVQQGDTWININIVN